MSWKRMLRLAAVALAAVILTAGCGGGRGERVNAGPAGGKVEIYTTIFPLYDFARNIGGDRVEVACLLPPGADPHHWEPTPGELVKIQNSDVFVYCGAGLERWAENALKSVGPGRRRVVVDCSRGIELLEGSGHGDEHESGADPHIWLDPVNAGIMVDNILAGLIAADPANKEYYAANAANYKERLADLDRRYREALAETKVKKFVVSHAAFGYLARRYGLEQASVRGLAADTEPSPSRMAEIVDLVRKHGIKYIFLEPLTSPRVSEAIARETGAGILVLNPIAVLTGEELKSGKNYLSLMEENLENLKMALEAK
ncbi:MAG: metal ABC transporter substrate-binding protein [Peptococcaceae bacterium]|nr:metal ABC transporter substrate-binding protein [Peptococcaceae bacterium]